MVFYFIKLAKFCKSTIMNSISHQVVHLRDFSSAGAYSFLKAMIEQNAPKPGKSVTVKYINPKIGNLVDIHIERVTAGKFELS